MRRFLIVPALVAVALVYALLDRESGVGTWLELRAELRAAWARNRALHREVDALGAEAAGLESDPFAIEKAIREDFGFGRPGETVVILPPREPR